MIHNLRKCQKQLTTNNPQVGLKTASLIAQLVKNLPAMQETLVRFLGREDPLEKRWLPTPVFLGFPCGSASKESTCERPGFNPWVGKISQRRERLPTPVFWPGEFHGLFSPWGRKESDMTERLSLSLSKIRLEIFITVFNYSFH